MSKNNNKINIAQLSKETGINYSTLQTRIKSGMPINQIRQTAVKSKQTIVVGGNRYDSLLQACKHYDLNSTTVRYRLKRKWSIEQAFGLINKISIDRVIINNVSYKSLVEASKMLGVSIGRVRYRLNNGWTLEEAFNITVKEQNHITIGNLKFKTLNKACEYYKLNYNTVCNRIKKEWTLEEAFELVERIPNYKFYIDNKGFVSFKAACRYYNVYPFTVSCRLSKGWSKEEAFGIIRRKQSLKCKGTLYIIKNDVNKKVYIGITTGRLVCRFNKHKNDAARGKSTKLCKAMRKYGVSKFRVKKLKRVYNKYELARLEVEYISKYNSIKRGYNTLNGGCSVS